MPALSIKDARRNDESPAGNHLVAQHANCLAVRHKPDLNGFRVEEGYAFLHLFHHNIRGEGQGAGGMRNAVDVSILLPLAPCSLPHLCCMCADTRYRSNSIAT